MSPISEPPADSQRDDWLGITYGERSYGGRTWSRVHGRVVPSSHAQEVLAAAIFINGKVYTASAGTGLGDETHHLMELVETIFQTFRIDEPTPASD